MLPVFLHQTFGRLKEASQNWRKLPQAESSCITGIDQIAEFVIDQVSNRLYAIPGGIRRLREPIANTMGYIDGLVEQVPGILRCQRSTFISDPRVNAFFVDQNHLQEVFSQSQEVRTLFENHPDLEECYGLLCMRGEERRQLGMALTDGLIRRDVMQTSLSFTDHQIFSPGSNEAEARCALKCCIFKSLIAHIQQQAIRTETEAYELESRYGALRARSRRFELDPSNDDDHSELWCQMRKIEQQLQDQMPRLISLEDRLRHVIDALSHPEQIVRAQTRSVHIDRMGIKHEQPNKTSHELLLSEILMGCQRPRVACLVCFRRDELLPRKDFLAEAGVFLAS